MLFIVTIKEPKNPAHNPHAKVTSSCTLSEACTDSTGEHHSLLVNAPDLDTALKYSRKRWSHVTRVEMVDEFHNTGKAES
jgi:hypothetical protein